MTTSQALALTISRLLYKAEQQKKVAETFKQCLTDTYRPHVTQNKLYGDAIEYLQLDLDQETTASQSFADRVEQIASAADQITRDALTEAVDTYRKRKSHGS